MKKDFLSDVSTKMTRTWAEIDLNALRENYRILHERVKKDSPRAKMICVLKADAYGHGAVDCGEALAEEGCDFFAVATPEEGIRLRTGLAERGVRAEILILGATDPAFLPAVREYGLTLTLADEEHAYRLNDAACAAGVRCRAHFAVNTGMNRCGFGTFSDAETLHSAEVFRRLFLTDGLQITGVYSHFSEADEESEFAGRVCEKQAERFGMFLGRAGVDRNPAVIKHLCNSAGALRYPKWHFDAVRLGIALYGVCPYPGAAGLRPVMRLRTLISSIRPLPAGESVGYGADYCAKEDRVIATLPIGYADGLLRACAGASVLVETEQGDFFATVIGRICMDQCMIDVTGLPVSVGCRVTVFGKTSSQLEALCRTAGTIPYELLCAVSSRVPRVPLL